MVYLGIQPMDKHPVEKGIEDVVRTYELLDRVRLGRDILIRDDQFEREALFDAARAARARGIRMGLLDTGRFDATELEALIAERVRVHTSDEARPREGELDRLLVACRRSRSMLAFFQNGPLEAEPESPTLSLPSLVALAAAGMDLHVSNRTVAREPAAVAALAEACRKGRAFLAYYHHGPLPEGLTDAAARGAWIHVSDRGLDTPGAVEIGLGIQGAARAAGSRLILYVERGMPLDALERFFASGAAVVFLTAPSDRRSLQRPLEEKARKRRLPLRASYLPPTFLP